jgi:hypothetical protein
MRFWRTCPLSRLPLISASLIVYVLACSSTDATYSCPKVGSRQCPSDPEWTETEVSECASEVAACGPQYNALINCFPALQEPDCDASGYSTMPTIPSSCMAQELAVYNCEEPIIARSMGDAGSH